MRELNKKNTCAVVLAAGVGSRMCSEVAKQRMYVGGMSVLRRSVLAFDNCPDISSIVVVIREDDEAFAKDELAAIEKPLRIVRGGRYRAESAKLGFLAIPEDTELVAIHDAARMLITPAAISSVIDAAAIYGAASAVSAMTDTVKLVDDNGYIGSTVSRESLRVAQTPQVFDVELYNKALSSVALGEYITDDNMLMEHIGVSVKAVDVECENIKITTKKDISYAEFVLKEREATDD